MIIKHIHHNILRWYRKARIKNKEITIISNNCWGGFMYQSCGLQYNTPLIGLYFYAPEYIKLLKDLKNNIEKPIIFIPKEKSKYAHLISKDYIIGVLGDTGIEIVFMHYQTEQEVLIKWERRKKRIHWDNMLVKFSDSDSARNEEYIHEFDKMPFANKVCFTGKAYPTCKSVIYMKEFKSQGYAYYEWAYSYKYYNFVKQVNKIPKR